tara:strand:+ start:298 stop:1278 length:981 start_codon:yes stop_codon:yes gene_type:complete
LYNKISIIGAGTWGVAIANHLSLKAPTYLSHYRKSFLKKIEEKRVHPNIKNFTIPDSVKINYGKEKKIDLYIISVPIQYIRSTLDVIRIPAHSNILILSKGIEKETLFFPSQIVRDKLNKKDNNIAILSGPSHAEQVLKKNPTSVVVGCNNEGFSKELQKLFSDKYFRVYSSNDMLGLELGGAVKNVIAIAAGIAYGLGYRENTISALLTRGIYEIKKIGLSIGVKENTLNGLGGIGDLIATSFSVDSRNRYVGIEIANGKNISNIINELKMHAEGLGTSKSLYQLSKKYNIELPICEMVYQIIYCNQNPENAINKLMNRELKSEF